MAESNGSDGMTDIHDVCDYIIIKLDEAGDAPSVLKIQKLIYYVQAWYLAFHKAPLFNDKFEAWVHGPVNRGIYDRFFPSKFMYSVITAEDSKGGADNINYPIKKHIDSILEVYAKFDGNQLEDMTHRELPWIQARKGLAASERCENHIDEKTMMEYYSARLG